jgi:hypothetical protein
MRKSIERLQHAAAFKPVYRRVAQSIGWARGVTGRRRRRRFFPFPLNGPHTATAFRNEKLDPMRATVTSTWAGTKPGETAGKRPPRHGFECEASLLEMLVVPRAVAQSRQGQGRPNSGWEQPGSGR